MQQPLQSSEHGGNIHLLINQGVVDPERCIDFSANMNPLGAPVWLRSLVNRELSLVTHYPDPNNRELISKISEFHEIPEENIVVTNGTSELLAFLPLVVEKENVIIPVPSYIDYEKVFSVHKKNVSLIYLNPENNFAVTPETFAGKLKGEEIVILGNPANPSGSFIERSSLLALIRSNPETVFIIDEAFLDFVEGYNSVGGVGSNIVTLNSLTKFYAIPGLRVGFGSLPSHYAERLKKLVPCWNVNALAQKVAVAALQDKEYQDLSRKNLAVLSRELRDSLAAFKELQVFDSKANYFLLRFKDGRSSEDLYQQCLKQSIIIRRCSNYAGLDSSYFRIAVRTRSENEKLLEAFREILSVEKEKKTGSRKKTPALMFQGTSSNAGKSILSTAMCRILLQDGFKVAPFKAQNMSLNSYVTRDGGEMGRAQVVQAQAAKVEPACEMNPILLKPNSHTGSQVIVNGRPVKNMNVSEYHRFKETVWASVTKSYDQLSLKYDCVVLEGAGSPGEVNLKQHDIVNMRMAEYAESPVLLVGDIDRGGVYASFAGIMDVLEEWERDLIKGFVVNKFRGDQSLLASAHEIIVNHTGKTVIGVIPHIADLSVPQEDSVSMKDGFYKHCKTEANQSRNCCVRSAAHLKFYRYRLSIL